MEFHVLGPLKIRGDRGEHLSITQPRYRSALCVLMLHEGHVLDRYDLANALWGADVPSNPAGALRSCVYSLRKALGASDRLRTQQGGYIIDLREGDFLDVREFRSLRKRGLRTAADDDLHGAARLLEQTLGLWCEPLLADFPQTPALSGAVSELVEERAHVLEVLADVQLALGLHRELVPSLRALASSDPLRERYWEQLVLALYRSGHQAAALDTYSQARSVLAEECGVDPGPGLRDLHQRMLAADPVLNDNMLWYRKARAGAQKTVSGPAVRRIDAGKEQAGDTPQVVPRQLPGAVSHFIGRKTEMDLLTALLLPLDPLEARIAVISAICGTAGVGKTALALQWAQRATEQFPEGQLYVNLNGYDQNPPLTASDALFIFLLSFGIAGRDIPATDEERAVRYQQLLAGRRMLIVLDNARDVEQVRPLLPRTATCATVVTSRDSLAGLVAREGAHRLILDALPLEDAVALLNDLIGMRATADVGATQVLAEQCCRLPLPLRIAAELALARPTASLTSLVSELGEYRQLDLLDAAGDPLTALRTVFSWSTNQLDSEAMRGFRVLGLHPGPYIDRDIAAALTGRTSEQATQMLAALARAHLLQATSHYRYTMHDLLRSYARELAAQEDETEQHAALTRLFNYYVETAIAAANTLDPRERRSCHFVSAPVTPIHEVTDKAAARAWLDSELASLVIVAAYTASHGWPHHTIALSEATFRHLNVGSHFTEAITMHDHARQAALQIADVPGEANALLHIGGIEARRARNKIAARHFASALALYKETDDRIGEASAEHNLGLLDLLLSRYLQARRHLKRALSIYQDKGVHHSTASTLTNLGLTELFQGHYRQAMTDMLQALALCKDTEGDQCYPAYALANLGLVELRTGCYQAAERHFVHAITLYQDIRYKPGEAYALVKFGLVNLRQGRHQEAEARILQALAIRKEIGDRRIQAEVLNSLGEVYLATARPDQAHIEFSTAIGQAALVGDKYERARALDGLGAAHMVVGELVHTRRYWLEALTIHASIGTPEADHIREKLRGLPGRNQIPLEQYEDDNNTPSWFAMALEVAPASEIPVIGRTAYKEHKDRLGLPPSRGLITSWQAT